MERMRTTQTQGIPFVQIEKILTTFCDEQRENAKNITTQSDVLEIENIMSELQRITSELQRLQHDLKVLADKINAANSMSAEEIEAMFDNITDKKVLRKIAASNASINENDREWARQALHKQGLL